MADMAYRRLGGSGLVVSVAGLGCNNFGMRIDLDATRAGGAPPPAPGGPLPDPSDPCGPGGDLGGGVRRGRRGGGVRAPRLGWWGGGAKGAEGGGGGSRRYIRK